MLLLLHHSEKCEYCHFFIYIISWSLKCLKFSCELRWYFLNRLFMFQLVFLTHVWDELNFFDAPWWFLRLGLQHNLCVYLWRIFWNLALFWTLAACFAIIYLLHSFLLFRAWIWILSWLLLVLMLVFQLLLKIRIYRVNVCTVTLL